jgi:sugar/nucleoside kinase (ribokinase family)
MARQGVVCGGSWCVDRNYVIDRWPAEETLAEILSEELQGGGSGTNMSVDLKKLGAPFPVEAIGLVGDDADGRFLIDLCDRLGVDHTQLRVSAEVATSVTEVMSVRTTGKRTFFYRAGAHDVIGPDHFDFGRTNAAILHLGLPGVHKTLDAPFEGDPSGWVTVLKRARAAGLKTNIELVSIAPERIAAIGRPLLAHLDLVVVNDVEAGAVAGIATVVDGRTDACACVAAANAILERGIAELVVVHFPLGAVAATRDGAVVEKPSVRVPAEAIAGTNGAGDAFAAGIVFGVHEGWPLEKSLALAHAGAAASLRSVTTNGAVEDWRECLRLAERWGWREAVG